MTSTFGEKCAYLVITICHIIRLPKCKHCNLTNSNQITYFVFFCLQGRWFSKTYIIFGAGMLKYLLFLTRVGGWSGKGQKHNLRTIKMVPYLDNKGLSRLGTCHSELRLAW